MGKDEFVQEARALGYTDDEIAEIVTLHEQAEKDGISIGWEDDLIEKPIR